MKIHELLKENLTSLDPNEYDQEGDMAQRQLLTAKDAADELRSILSTDENLPEWVQKKIALAVDYLDTVRDYMKATKQQNMAEEKQKGVDGKEVDENLEVTDDHISRVHNAIKKLRQKHGTFAFHTASSIAKEAGKGITPHHVHAAFGANIKSQTEKGGRMVTNQLKTRSNEPNRYGWKTRDEWLKEKVDIDSLTEEKQKGVDGKACWKGYKRMGTKMKGGKRVDNCVPIKGKKK